MLINKLNLAFALQENAKIIKPGDNALQFDAIDQEYGHWNFVFADVVEKYVL